MLTDPNHRHLYIGVTSNLAERIHHHLHRVIDSWPRARGCTKLVFYEMYPSIWECIAREKQLKKWTRAKKEALIDLANPTRVNLIIDLGDEGRYLEIGAMPNDVDTRYA